MIEKLRLIIKKELEDRFSIDNIIVELPKRGESDLSIPLFGYAKSLNKNITEVYETFKEALLGFDFIVNIEFVAGFLNIFIERINQSIEVLMNVYKLKDNYGSLPKNNKTVVLDYSAPNIAKNFGVGHLRSTVIGNSLKLLYEKLGYNTVGINHLGDWGTQFGRMIVAFKKWGNMELLDENPIDELQRLYVKFHEEEENDPKLDQQGRDAFLKLEQNDPEYTHLWQKFKDESLKEFMKIYDILNVSFDSYDGEAFFNDKMDNVINELKSKGLLVEDDGAQVVFVGDDIPPVIFIRSDGATLYATRDLAALLYRYNKYHFDEILYVVGNEQTLHFESLKRVVQKMGYNLDIQHINFGLITVDGKKMSTRKGRFANLKNVLDEAINLALEQISSKNPSLDNKTEVAKDIGVGAVIFNDLKNERHLNCEFNLNNMVRFEGQTGPYLQYSIVRINSILRNTTLNIEDIDSKVFDDTLYFNLVKVIDQFPDIVIKAKQTKMPSYVAKYLLSLASEFNSFYAKVKINVDDEAIRNANLLLIYDIKEILKEGLRLLGIKALEVM